MKRKVVIAGFCFFASLNLAKAQSSESFMDREQPGQHKYKLNLKQMTGLEKASSETFGATQQFDANVYLPVYQKEEFTFAILGKSQHLHFSNLTAKNSFVPITDLYTQQIGLSWSFLDQDKNTWKVAGGYGSASDKPFKNSDSSVFDLNLSKKVQISKTDSWTYFLNYSNNRGFLNNIPLPGFMYSTMNETMTQGGVFGIPFLSYWIRPTDKIMLTAFYFYSQTGSLQASYNFSKAYQAGLKISSGQQSYMRSDRQNRKDRIIYATNKAATSFKAHLGETLNLELELAKVFNRSIFEGKDVASLSSDRLELPEEDQATFSLQSSF